MDVRQQRGGGTAGRRHRDRDVTAWMIETPCPRRHGRPKGPPLHAAGGIRAHAGAARRKHVVRAGLVPARVPNRMRRSRRAETRGTAATSPPPRTRWQCLARSATGGHKGRPYIESDSAWGPHRPISPFAAAQIRPLAPQGTALHEIHPPCAAKGDPSPFAIYRLPLAARGSPSTPGGVALESAVGAG